MNSSDFGRLGLSETVRTAVERKGYRRATPVQEAAIPVLLEGRDLVATAQTGTGKTAAFLLPLIDRFVSGQLAGDARRGPLVLILAPTRELAAQIGESAEGYAAASGMRHTVVFGGVPKGKQLSELRKRPHLLVATPGRLLDLLGDRALSLAGVRALVLDEADRMLDMGFIPDVRRIAAALPATRQTALFSATMPQAIESLAAELLLEPARVAIGRPAGSTTEGVQQEVLHVSQPQKTGTVSGLIRSREMERDIVFTRTKHKASRLAKQLSTHGLRADSIHGDRSQSQRQRALRDFRDGRVRVLVATDIAARGIDVSDVSHVINYDLPNEPESYVHRIGRTARAGSTGHAVSLCDPSELPHLRAIERFQNATLDVHRDHEHHLEPPVERSSPRGASRGGSTAKPSGGSSRRRSRSRRGPTSR